MIGLDVAGYGIAIALVIAAMSVLVAAVAGFIDTWRDL
jgi:hypothetical protein